MFDDHGFSFTQPNEAGAATMMGRAKQAQEWAGLETHVDGSKFRATLAGCSIWKAMHNNCDDVPTLVSDVRRVMEFLEGAIDPCGPCIRHTANVSLKESEHGLVRWDYFAVVREMCSNYTIVEEENVREVDVMRGGYDSVIRGIAEDIVNCARHRDIRIAVRSSEVHPVQRFAKIRLVEKIPDADVIIMACSLARRKLPFSTIRSVIIAVTIMYGMAPMNWSRDRAWFCDINNGHHMVEDQDRYVGEFERLMKVRIRVMAIRQVGELVEVIDGDFKMIKRAVNLLMPPSLTGRRALGHVTKKRSSSGDELRIANRKDVQTIQKEVQTAMTACMQRQQRSIVRQRAELWLETLATKFVPADVNNGYVAAMIDALRHAIRTTLTLEVTMWAIHWALTIAGLCEDREEVGISVQKMGAYFLLRLLHIEWCDVTEYGYYEDVWFTSSHTFTGSATRSALLVDKAAIECALLTMLRAATARMAATAADEYSYARVVGNMIGSGKASLVAHRMTIMKEEMDRGITMTDIYRSCHARSKNTGFAVLVRGSFTRVTTHSSVSKISIGVAAQKSAVKLVVARSPVEVVADHPDEQQQVSTPALMNHHSEWDDDDDEDQAMWEVEDVEQPNQTFILDY